jgi:MFS transporter, DHA2 family, methylenomycin A resistance protein
MCISQGMILLDITIVNIALPAIQRELHESGATLEWVVSAYALSLAALIPVSGTLGDRYGRKRLFTIGMTVFTLGSVACALSPSAIALTGARAVQGVGGAIMSALTLSILTETYPRQARARAIGTWATCAAVGFGLGPVVGGLLLGTFGWSSIFWVNVPFGVAGLLLAIIAVTESRDPAARRLDLPGLVTSALGLLGLTFGLIESASHPWSSAQVAAPLGTGLVLLAAFAWWERRAPSPMIPPALLAHRSFAASCGIYMLAYAGLTGAMFYLTLLYQDVDGWSALLTGLSWLTMNVPFMVMAQLSGRLSRRFPAIGVIVAGCLAGAAGIGVLSTITPTTSFSVAAIGYVLLGAGYGTAIPAVTTVAMRDVPTGYSGIAAGVINTSRQIGTSVGLAVLGTVGAAAATAEWAGRAGHLHGFARWNRDVATAQVSAVERPLGHAYRHAAALSFTHGFQIAVACAGSCMLAAAVLAWAGLRSRARRSAAGARGLSRSSPDEQVAVRDVGDEHVTRCVRESERQARGPDRRLRRDAAGPEHGDIAWPDHRRIAEVRH